MKENKKPKISMIAAVGKNRELGKANQLLWHIPEDLKHFKEKTLSHAVIMGQKTFDSIGKPLPDRLNIVLSNDPSFKADGIAIASSIDDAITIASDYSDEIFIIGGGSIYAQFIDKADKLYLTLVDAEFEADVFFPEYKKFKIIKEEDWQTSDDIKFKFTEWNRF